MSGVSKAKATRNMRIAQVVGLGMVALAAGAVILKPGLPERAPDQPTAFDPGLGDQPTDTRKPNQQRPEIDVAIAGNNLDVLMDRVKTPTIEPKPVGGEENEKPETPVSAPRGWAYLGGVFEPKVSFALVNINGKQRMLRQGQELPELDAKILSIGPDGIEIEREGMRERIERSKPAGTLVSVSEPGGGSSTGIIAPGEATPQDMRAMQRDELRNNPDLDKRRAEFLRRQQERQGIER